MTPSDSERALDALFRTGRVDPSSADLARIETRLAPYLAASPAPKSDGFGSAALKSALLLVGFSLFSPSQVYEMHAGPGPSVATVAPAPDAPFVGHTQEAPVPSTEASISVTDLPNARRVVTPKRTTVPAKANATGLTAETASPAVTSSSDESGPAQVREEPEANYLRRAQAMVNADPAGALATLREHPARYPHGFLVQERDVMIIDSLVRLGRMDEARARAKSFSAAYPSSAHASRIESLVEAAR